MSEVIREYGIIPFFRSGIPGWSVEEMTAPGCWFTEDEENGTLGPWDWKIDVVREGDIAYGKFLGGKAAFATVEYYRELMNWRRCLPKYRAVLGEAHQPVSANERLMQRLAPAVYDAVCKSGSLESAEIRRICCGIQPGIRKATVDNLMQFLQMGTWTVTGDFRRVYRGPNLSYSGWQRASNVRPEDLFVSDSGGEPNAPFWAKMFEERAADRGLSVERTPEESREFLINRVLGIFPDADRKLLEKLF